MVYLRAKKVKGDQYLYLVHSFWDSERSTSKQKILKYLGKASKVRFEDIPKEYRDNPQITSFLSTHSAVGLKKREKTNKRFQKNLFESMQAGDVDCAYSIYQDFKKSSGTTDFFEDVLRPVLFRVGQLWSQKKLGIGAEHVCSNVATRLVERIMQNLGGPARKGRILLCTPVGEEHQIGCKILESYMACKGFEVQNMAPSAPAESVIYHAKQNRPDYIFVSVTIPDNIGASKRLVDKLVGAFDIPVIVGGQAATEETEYPGAIVVGSMTLTKIPRLLRSLK